MSELPELRASDADRERAADTLRRAAGVGRLTMDELDERLNAAYDARTRAELELLVADVVAEDEQEPAHRMPVRRGAGGAKWIVSIMGGSDRKGRWRVGRTCTVVNVMGGSDIHLNDAELAADVVELRIFSLMGGSDVWIPDGLAVEVSEFAFMGGNEVRIGEARPGDGGPLLRLKLISIMGGTTVRRGRKKSRAERRLEREQRKHLGH